MPRTIWSGAISFGLVSMPINVVGATEDHSIRFPQYHLEDMGRVRYRKVCELEDREVSQDEIGKGYELSKTQVIPITDEELGNLPLPTAKTPHVATPLSSGGKSSVHGAEVEPLAPLVGVRSRVGGHDRVRAGLDEVEERPGDAVAVVGTEAGDKRSGFFSGDWSRNRFELLDAPVDLFFARVPVGERAGGNENLHFGSHGRMIGCLRHCGQGILAGQAAAPRQARVSGTRTPRRRARALKTVVELSDHAVEKVALASCVPVAARRKFTAWVGDRGRPGAHHHPH
ncbi:Ku protein [Streptomyces puniciscabiei]|uniref:Ku protein n=1 Tax=Streptomyces puniciscabiei TaxID=164348 RepID=UPI00331E1832